MRHGSVLVCILLLLKTLPAEAEKLEIGIGGTYEVRVADLEPGQRAAVTVYLQSSGDLVADYQVLLVDSNTNAEVASALTDEVGEIKFNNVPAGSYMAVLNLPEKIRRITTVKVGDVRIVPLKSKEEKKDNSSTISSLISEEGERK